MLSRLFTQGINTAVAVACGGTNNYMLTPNTSNRNSNMNGLLFQLDSICVYENHLNTVQNLGVLDNVIMGYQMKALTNQYETGSSQYQQYFLDP